MKQPNSRYRLALDFTFSGILYSFMILFMGLAAVNTGVNPLYAVFGLMIGVLMIAMLISRLVIRKLHVTRQFPDSAVVAQEVTFTYQCTNKKRFWPSLSVSLRELDSPEAFVKPPMAYMLHTAPRMTATVITQVIPARRGLHVLNHYQLTTSFPFGFIRRSIVCEERDNIVVFPAIAQVHPDLLRMVRSADRAGAAFHPRRGGDDEFYGIKEYRAGENPRSIYWRRSARTGVLVSREMTQVAPPRLILIVDTHNDDSEGALAMVERNIAHAASLASHALEAGLMVGLFAWAGNFIHIPPNRGKRHRRDLLSHLAQLPHNYNVESNALFDAARMALKAQASAILFTPRSGQMSLAQAARSPIMVIGADSDDATKWFTFDSAVDFAGCAPVQSPGDAASPRDRASTAQKKNVAREAVLK